MTNLHLMLIMCVFLSLSESSAASASCGFVLYMPENSYGDLKMKDIRRQISRSRYDACNECVCVWIGIRVRHLWPKLETKQQNIAPRIVHRLGKQHTLSDEWRGVFWSYRLMDILDWQMVCVVNVFKFFIKQIDGCFNRGFREVRDPRLILAIINFCPSDRLALKKGNESRSIHLSLKYSLMVGSKLRKRKASFDHVFFLLIQIVFFIRQRSQTAIAS